MKEYRDNTKEKNKAAAQSSAIMEQAELLGVDPRIARALAEIGFTSFTPIQEQTIPALLQGRDVIGQAQTGTGKTAAFGIPLLQNTDPEDRNVQAIVLCPTRELAIQASEELRKFAKYMHGIKILPIYGGQEIGKQIKALKAVQIIVGTPGRVMDHMRRHTLKLGTLKMMVLDEADEMLNMGFREDIEQILKDVPQERQTALFSATMPKPILDITHTYQRPDAEYVKVTSEELTIPLVKQYFYVVRHDMKKEAAARLLDYYVPTRSLIFCNTKKMVDDLAKYLKGRGYQAEGLHGDLSQAQRDRVMHGFRSGAVNILIATDVAARGIDVDDVEAVLNFDIPQDNEYYVHRIGRTGRAGRKGQSFTLVTTRERARIREIERFCKTKIEGSRLPSAQDVEQVKANQVLDRIKEIQNGQELGKMRSLLAAWLEQEQMSMEEAAAALLKLVMGEESEEIPEAEQREHNRRRDNADAGRSARNRKGAGRDGSRAERTRKNTGGDGARTERTGKNAGGDGARTERTRKNDGRNSKRADEAKRSAGKGNSGVRADRAMKNAGGDGARTERTRKNAGGDGGRAEQTRKNDGRNSKRADEAKRSAGKGNSGVRADRAMKNTGRDGSRTERTESGRANAGIAEERKKQMPPKDLRTDGTPAPEKRRRHDHTGQRKKLMTGENKDYGYDTDASVYHRPDIHPGHTLEIKTKEEDGRSAQKKTAKKRTFRLFGKK